MTIKTKYEIGQDVWVMYHNRPQKATIAVIDVRVTSALNLSIEYRLQGASYESPYKEDQVFKTADALKKYLFEQ